MPDFCSRRHPFHYVAALNTLRKLGVDLARVNLLAVGRFGSYRGEVMLQEPEPTTALGPSIEITLHVAALSAVDYMPYQFFYGLEGGRDRSDEWETRARELMAPFDSAAVRMEAKAGHLGQRYNLGVVDSHHLGRFLELFQFHTSDQSPLSELLFWLAALPAAHLWAGNGRGTAAVCSYLMGCPVEIVESRPGVFEMPENCRSPLGTRNARLGKNLVAGHSFAEFESTYEVVVEGVTSERLPAFLPGGRDRRKLEWLLGVCMPSYLEYRIRVVPESQSAAVGGNRRQCFLGYSSYVGGAKGS